jgi:Tfp pilus assembly protein PilV
MEKKQSGFSIVEILIIIVTVGLVGTVGWLVYDKQKSKDITSTQKQATETAVAASDTPARISEKSTTPAPNTTEGYLVVKEWGVKIKLEDAEKVSYKMSGTPNGASANADGVISSAVLSLISSIEASDKCKPVGVSLSQHTAAFGAPGSGANVRIVGNYSYGVDGGLNVCGNKTVDAFKEKIFNELIKLDFSAI